MAAQPEHRGSRVAAVLLTLAAALAAGAAAQNNTAGGVTTGLSALTIKNYPLPPAFMCAASVWAHESRRPHAQACCHALTPSADGHPHAG